MSKLHQSIGPGGGGLHLRKVFVQRRPLWTVGGGGEEAQVSGRHYATSLNHIRS